MKKRIFIRNIESRQPTEQQLDSYYHALWELRQKRYPNIEKKIVIRDKDGVYILIDKEKVDTMRISDSN